MQILETALGLNAFSCGFAADADAASHPAGRDLSATETPITARSEPCISQEEKLP